MGSTVSDMGRARLSETLSHPVAGARPTELRTTIGPMPRSQAETVRSANGDGALARSRELFLQPVASYNPFEETVAQLVRAIRLGAVPVGDKFPPERELAESLGISRTTVREAIRGLEQAGYVTTRRGRFGGTFVLRQRAESRSQEHRTLLGPKLLETLDYREIVEPGAAALAARRATPQLVAQLEEMLSAMEGGPEEDYLRANCRLHMAIAQGADCRPLLSAVTSVELRVMEALLVLPRLERSIEHSHKQHRAIVSAIAAHDEDAARAAMAEHIAGADVVLRELTSARRRSR